MKNTSNNYIDQFKLLFYISWIIIYFIFPSWRFSQIYVPVKGELIISPISPTIILLTYFFIAAFILNICFKFVSVSQPVVFVQENLSEFVSNHLWLIIVCFIAATIHIFRYEPISSLTVDCALWIYNFLTYHLHRQFHFPIQYPLWALLFSLILVLSWKRSAHFIYASFNSAYSLYRSSILFKFLLIILCLGIFFFYTLMLPEYSWQDHLLITGGYPPLGTIMYLILYLLFGTGDVFIAPAILQLTFYIFSAIFLYRTILLYLGKDAALLGASIYLFSPIIFTYATLAPLESGTIFFIIIISYFFLKYIRDAENRDLLLSAYFIGTGSLYKQIIIWMLPVCCVYLFVLKIKRKDLPLIRNLAVLSLSAITFLPWHLIGTRALKVFVLSHITTPKILFESLLMIPTQLSWPIFMLLILSIFFATYKRDPLSIFFGLVYITYYLLFTLVQQRTVPRYTTAFYPAISVFLSHFIYRIFQNPKWKKAFTPVSAVLIIYLAILCIVPRTSTNFISFKYHDFENQRWPDDKAAEWILKETGNDDRILALVRKGMIFSFVADKAPGRADNLILLTTLDVAELFPSRDFEAFRQNLIDFCAEQKISYIVSVAGKAQSMHPARMPFLEPDVRKFMEDDKYDDFVLAAKFNIDDNYILIYKLKDKFIAKP